MEINVLEYLEKTAVSFPDKIVFAEENKELTFHELLNNSKKIGSKLIEKYQQRKKPVVVFVDRNIESLVMFMGVTYSGNFYVPIDKNMPKLRIELILDVLKPVAAIVLESEIEYIKNIAPDLEFVTYEESLKNPVDEKELHQIRITSIDTDPLYATFTSGSTGVPKGVLTCHRSLIDLTEALTETFDFNESTILGNQNPFYFDASIKDIFCTLKCGSTMYIVPKKCFTFIGTLSSFLNEKKINTILWSAAAIGLVANADAFSEVIPQYLNQVMFSGEVMHNKVLNYWRRNLPNTKFVNLYGPTEITSICTYYKIEKIYSDEEVLPIGIPFKNTDILILTDDNKLAEIEEKGELCVRGCCLALGYYNNPEKTEEAFVQNPLNKSYPEMIYRTGDIAKYDEDGQLIFFSRKDNQVKHMGQRVELGEIEIVVNSLEKIDASICFYDHDENKIVLAFQGNDVNNKYIL
ncbi:MAG: amino acid adenylation domain-containing protein, partial [Mariniphaga sp.]|nr:amino acid adenylation domain-containing protein [Mariniphaga sp.]